MIANEKIKEKVLEHTKDDEIMQKFLVDIINHETESTQFRNYYKNLISEAADKRG